jgi:hypothetical protein
VRTIAPGARLDREQLAQEVERTPAAHEDERGAVDERRLRLHRATGAVR